VSLAFLSLYTGDSEAERGRRVDTREDCHEHREIARAQFGRFLCSSPLSLLSLLRFSSYLLFKLIRFRCFAGRRILRLYLTLHLNSKLSASHPSLLAHAVSPRAIDALLNTKQLGATVGAAWKLEDSMRWREVKGPTGEMTGLWKVRGMGVEAVMGGVFTSQANQYSLVCVDFELD